MEIEESMELSHNPCSQVTDGATRPKTTSFFLLQKFRGNQLVSKMATMCLAHLEEGSPRGEEEDKPKDPDGIDGVMEEFMVHLAWVPTDAEVEERHCYRCCSPEHFIHNCPLVKASKKNAQLDCREGMALWGEPRPLR